MFIQALRAVLDGRRRPVTACSMEANCDGWEEIIKNVSMKFGVRLL